MDEYQCDPNKGGARMYEYIVFTFRMQLSGTYMMLAISIEGSFHMLGDFVDHENRTFKPVPLDSY